MGNQIIHDLNFDLFYASVSKVIWVLQKKIIQTQTCLIKRHIRTTHENVFVLNNCLTLTYNDT